jgi:hypothetical protein
VLVGIAVVLVLVYFAVLIYLLLAELGSNPDRWRRAVQLMQALGAVALTAAGFLFGREVNRKRAENAEERAESVHQLAIAAKEQAAQSTSNGKALAAAIQAKAKQLSTSQPSTGGLEAMGPVEESQGQATGHLDELADLASHLFPPTS